MLSMASSSRCPSLSYWDMSPFTAVRRAIGGWFKNPVSEVLTLYCFAKALLEHTPLPIPRSTDHDVAQTDIMLWAWRTAANAYHQTDSGIRKAVQHVFYDACCRGYAVLPVGQEGDDDIVFPNFAQCVIVVVIRRHMVPHAFRR